MHRVRFRVVSGEAAGPARLAAFAAVALSLGLVACGGGGGGGKSNPAAATTPDAAIVAQIPRPVDLKSRQAQGTYVGTAGRTANPYVAFVVQKGRVVVYVCDGKRFSDWFGGKLTHSGFNLKTQKGTRISGTVTRRTVTGTLTLAGRSALKYGAQSAVNGKTGLFVGKDASPGYTRRWILTADGVRGLSASETGGVKNATVVTEGGSAGTQTQTSTESGGTKPVPVDCQEFVANGCNRTCDDLLRQQRGLIKDSLRSDIDQGTRNIDIKLAGDFIAQRRENNC